MTLQERLDAARQRSVSLYLTRTKLQEDMQQMQMRGMSIDRELVALDGEERVLMQLIAEDVK